MESSRQGGWVCRGIRGAICCQSNTAEAIVGATRQLLAALIEANEIDDPTQISSIFFTASPDLDAAYPAQAAREVGLADVAMLCAQEIGVPGGPERCIRVLVQWNTARAPEAIEHIYLGEAASLRPERRWPRPAEQGG